MYNSTTEQKIKNIPNIGDIDTDRLPQELTRIYAQIVSLRRQVTDGTINSQDENLVSGLTLLRRLANNLETILLINPKHEQKESIAFVAGTANNLIHKMRLINTQPEDLLEIDSISSYIAATILFLIGNSQADAAETALSISESDGSNIIQQQLISSIIFLATGKLSKIEDNYFNESNINVNDDIQTIALDYLWRELGLGIMHLSKRLVGQVEEKEQSYFDNVIELSKSEPGLFDQKSVFSGPLRLAKLLKILGEDIFNRAVIDIPPPLGIDYIPWQVFLQKLANDRPYLWENHKEAINTNFLNPGVSAVLTLPTGAGKSTLSELKIASCLYSNKKVIYLVPTHALEDQVSKNLKLLFAEFESLNIELGGEYSDFEELNNFPILVMTPERCLTFQNINPDFFNSVGLIVFDEFHLIHGTDIKRDRRSIDAMYCLLSLFTIAQHADYLLISAMVENGKEIASWLEQITKRECKLFNSTWKPTRQLHGCLVFEENDINKLNNQIYLSRNENNTTNPSSQLKKNMTIKPHLFFSLKNIWETTNSNDYFKTEILDKNVTLGLNKYWGITSNRNETAIDLAVHFSKLGLKILVFADNPKITNSISRTIAEKLKNNQNKYDEYVNLNKKLIESLHQELGDISHSYFHKCENVGVHHGLLLPIERGLIENYFKYSNGASVLIATATLAQGINLPAEIVIIAGDDRYNKDTEKIQQVNPHDILNAAGRAGRAGLSSQGAVILIPGKIVTIRNSTISSKWWELKNNTFSKGDQCLKIEDPLEYLLDNIQEKLEELSVEQTNILYRFKPETSSKIDTKNMLNKSLYAFKAANSAKIEQFDTQVRRLLDRRNELDNLSEEYLWQKEIGIKTGLGPSIIIDLGNVVAQQGIETLLSKSIIQLIDWFFEWLSTNEVSIEKIFTKQSTIDQIKKAVGLTPATIISDIHPKINILAYILKLYVQGEQLIVINTAIPDVNNTDNTTFLTKARDFVNRLLPELSFAFGLLSMILIERAKQIGIEKQNIPMDIKVLASCIREGFDSSNKLFYKKNNRLSMRVETHLAFKG